MHSVFIYLVQAVVHGWRLMGISRCGNGVLMLSASNRSQAILELYLRTQLYSDTPHPTFAHWMPVNESAIG